MSADLRGAAPLEIGRLIDAGRWSGYQRWLVFLVALMVVFDGVDNQLLGIVIPTLMGEWGVPRRAFASVVSYGYAGMMVGGAIAGLAGDRIGRRAALLGSVVAVRRHDRRVGPGPLTSGARDPATACRHRSRRGNAERCGAGC